MRSGREIAFRLRQEAANLWLAWTAPRPGSPPPAAPLAGLPELPIEPEVVRVADEICAHRFSIFGGVIDTGPEIDWRRDYRHKVSTGVAYFRRIPYLDFSRVGDHKFVWELNRHQHLVVLAQAWVVTGNRRYLEEIAGQIESWTEANPFQRSINWASALEVAFRALSWIWLYHLAGAALDAVTRARIWTGLYRHGLHIEYNLSVYFSPNTHLLGEAVALHALGVIFSASRWRKLGREMVLRQMEFQVREDGSHFEQSTYYHQYAVDFFALHDALEAGPDWYRARLRRMAEYLVAVMGPAGELPLLGDDDGGRVLTILSRPIANLPQDAILPHFFPDSGLAVMTAGDIHVLVDGGGFGTGSAGHSHSDTLSIVARRGEEEILIDPGTFTYVADPKARNWFRGSAAHNVVRVDGADQAVAAGPFRWVGKPEVRIREWRPGEAFDLLDAECTLRDAVWRRRVVFDKREERLYVADDVEGAADREHDFEQFWHLGSLAAGARLSVDGGRIEEGWRSRVYGSREPSPVLVVSGRGRLPVRLMAAVDLAAVPRPPISANLQAEFWRRFERRGT